MVSVFRKMVSFDENRSHHFSPNGILENGPNDTLENHAQNTHGNMLSISYGHWQRFPLLIDKQIQRLHEELLLMNSLVHLELSSRRSWRNSAPELKSLLAKPLVDVNLQDDECAYRSLTIC